MLKMTGRSFMLFCLLLAMYGNVSAQKSQHKMYYNTPDYIEPSGWGVGFNFGLSDLWGDVGTKGIVDHYKNSSYWSKPHFMGGVFGRYTVVPALGIRLGVNYGTLFADDAWNKSKALEATNAENDYVQRYYRNLNVKTNVWEGSFLFEINPFRLGNLEPRSKVFKNFQPYLLAGVGYFHFQPKGQLVSRLNGSKRWVNLYDLHIEGDGFKGFDGMPLADAPEEYNRWQLNVPLGIGFRWDIGHQLDLGIEYQYRMCFTDYLDNVSGNYIDPALYDINLSERDAQAARDLTDKTFAVQPDAATRTSGIRGNKAVNDAYSTVSISIFYKIKSKRLPWWWKYE